MTPPRTGETTATTPAQQQRATQAPTPILEDLRRACDRIAPLWPLDRFTAVNPYMGVTDLTFPQAVALLEATIGARGTLPHDFYLEAVAEGRVTARDLDAALAAGDVAARDAAELLEDAAADDDEVRLRVPTVAAAATGVTGTDWVRVATERVAAWAAAYFDGGQASWRSVAADASPYASWLEEARVDRTPEVLGVRGFRRYVADLPDDPVAAARRSLETLGVPAGGRDHYLHRILLELRGWAGHAAWIGWERRLRGGDDDTLLELLAVLLCWEAGLLVCLDDEDVAAAWDAACTTLAELGAGIAPSPRTARRLVLQDAFDRAEQRRLVTTLDGARSEAPGPRPRTLAGRPHAQAVFCIDVRSEVLRRHLETVAADVDTVGFAGFFGMPIEYVPLAHEDGGAQCPALLAPAYTVRESLDDPEQQAQAEDRRRLVHHVRRAWKSFKEGAVTCFGFVSPVGLSYLPKLVTDGLGWTRPVARPDAEGLGAAAEGRGPTLAAGRLGDRVTGIPFEDRVDLAESALRGMSLAEGLAPLVVLAGHGASTVNNPYETGLHCGACGGHTGEANARVAASVLNDLRVRNALVAREIHVPEDTWFVPALHDTTTDEVTVHDRHLVPITHRELLSEVEEQFAEAGRRSRAERAGRLGLDEAHDVDAAVRRRSRDWAEVRPEWGLAGCRSFVVAPRHRTRGVDLEGQAFLHDYDWRQDRGFDVLELVMTAPMVVATWINLQYYASTVDNDVFGAGNKTLHNVVGKLGVLEGNAGDLRVGLPWQSVHDGERHQHEPVRCNVVIEAPVPAMTEVLAAHDDVRQLCDNGWLHLLAMGEDGRVTHRYVGDLAWEELPA